MNFPPKNKNYFPSEMKITTFKPFTPHHSLWVHRWFTCHTLNCCCCCCCPPPSIPPFPHQFSSFHSFLLLLRAIALIISHANHPQSRQNLSYNRHIGTPFIWIFTGRYIVHCTPRFSFAGWCSFAPRLQSSFNLFCSFSVSFSFKNNFHQAFLSEEIPMPICLTSRIQRY